MEEVSSGIVLNLDHTMIRFLFTYSTILFSSEWSTWGHWMWWSTLSESILINLVTDFTVTLTFWYLKQPTKVIYYWVSICSWLLREWLWLFPSWDTSATSWGQWPIYFAWHQIPYIQPLTRMRSSISKVCKFLNIIVMPCTNEVSKRSVSTLHRIKTYLRKTMDQPQLDHLMILHIHKESTDELSLESCLIEFVVISEHRLSIFGRFWTFDNL